MQCREQTVISINKHTHDAGPFNGSTVPFMVPINDGQIPRSLVVFNKANLLYAEDVIA